MKKNFFKELSDIKEILSPSAEGSMLFEREISRRQSISDTKYSHILAFFLSKDFLFDFE